MDALDFRSLADKLGNPASLITDVTPYEAYTHDATEASGQPLAIVMAESADDVAATIAFCNHNRLDVVARGAGTGLSGGCIPAENSVVLSTERIDHINLMPTEMIAICGPGVITNDLMKAAAEVGLTYPPDPASYEESTLGGNVAENAGGLRCKRFGVTRDYVIGLRGLLADGSIFETGIFNEKSGFGYGDLMIGSEGTLGVITEIGIRLIHQPEVGDTILVAFDDATDAARTVADIVGSGIVPTVLEYIDGDAAACSNQYEKTEGLEAADAILLIETRHFLDRRDTSSVSEICKQNKCTFLKVESDSMKTDKLWKVRRNLSNATKAIATYRISEDVAVPISKFPILVQFVSEMNRTCDLRINAFGHAGDGNLHVNFLGQDGSPTERRQIETEVRRLLKQTIKLNGTLSGEHGIGLAKRDYLDLEFDRPTLALMKSIKSIFDPDCRLNSGKIFTDS